MDDGHGHLDRGAEHDVGGSARLMHADRGSRQAPMRSRRRGRARAGATRLGQSDAPLVYLHREVAGPRAGDDELDVDASGYELVDMLTASKELVVTLELGHVEHQVRVADVDASGVEHVVSRELEIVADLGDAHVDGGAMDGRFIGGLDADGALAGV